MRRLRVSLLVCICLLHGLTVFATDNSFKLDFNGDGRTDIALYREGSRAGDIAPQPSYWFFLDTQTHQMFVRQWGRSLDVPAPADYDNDGITDVGIYRWWDFETGDTNEWWLSKSAGGHQVILSYELGYSKFNRNYFGDGRAEVGQLYQVDISQNPGETCFISIYFVADLDRNVIRKTIGDACNVNPLPIPGDYNNDGYSEIAVFDNQTFKVWLPPYSSSYTAPDLSHVMDIEIPTPGDFDGDGKTDFAGTKGQNGRMLWRIKRSDGGPDIEEDFGFSTDKPVPGDYDGDNKTDIAVFRPSDGSWWIKNSGSGAVTSFYFGLPTDTPLAMPAIPFSPN
ncbi:MAG TPA: VCBS repeat-containing protein [Pyrinomonadaceae bacterium]